MKKLYITLLIIFLIISYLVGGSLLQERNWNGMDCHEDTTSYLAEDDCKAHTIRMTNGILVFDGIKLILSPAWAPIAVIGMIVN